MNHEELLQWLRDCKINYRGNRPYIWEVMQLLLKEIDALKTRLDEKEEGLSKYAWSPKDLLPLNETTAEIPKETKKEIMEMYHKRSLLFAKNLIGKPKIIDKPDLLQAAKDLSKKDKRDIWDD